ncbi:DUF427 domain-containing protein [Streptomyces sp. NPDC047737]|uniref:DUF427 domain-containing protein n=1 Tax=unclassified Streptomyces TaxID=2593676 RepID=UPI0033E165D1
MTAPRPAPEAVPVVRRRDERDSVFWEPSERWVRATAGQVTVVDSREPVLVWEPGRPVPLYAFPAGDVRTDLLRRTERPAARRHAGATVFYDLVLPDRTVPAAAWTYPGADLAGHISFEWFGREVLDHWYEEDEEIFVHPRDPHKRVDALPSSRHVQVEIEGTVVADTHAPILLFETGLPVRFYLPREDVRLGLFTRTDGRTRCPYKGVASEYWSWAGDADVRHDIAWSYPDPLPSVGIIKDRVAFYDESVDVLVDGVRRERPVTFFSRPSR